MVSHLSFIVAAVNGVPGEASVGTATPRATSAGGKRPAPAPCGTVPPGMCLSYSRAGLTSESSRAGWGLCIDYSLPFQVSVNLSGGIPPYPKFWSHRMCPLSPQQSRGRGFLSAPPPPNPGSILGGGLLSFPPSSFFFLCSVKC